MGLPAWAAEAPIDEVKSKNGITYRGELTQYDERGILIKILPGGKIVAISPEEVAGVKANLTDGHVAGDDAFAKGKFTDAVRNFESALLAERRLWAKQRIRSTLIRSLRKSGQLRRAAEEFLAIAPEREDPDVMVLAPILWMEADKPSPDDLAQAKRWVADTSNPMAQLIGASWLIASKDAAAALSTLDRLQTVTDQRVSMLARAQLQRPLLGGSKPLDPAAVKRYSELIQKMPVAVRAGPQYLLGLEYERLNQPADAALAFLWTPFVYATYDADMAADAMLRAARASEKAGFANDARNLYREVIETYPGTAFAKEAQATLKPVGEGKR